MYFTAINVIYAIIHPNTGQIMYVGQTKDLRDRIKSHTKSQRTYRGKTKLYNWIRKRHREGFEPLFIILENVESRNLLDEREIYWIAKLTPKLNHTSGGTNCRFLIKKKTKYKYDLEKITEMVEGGCTVKDVSDFVGCNKETASSFLRRNGLKTKNSLTCKPDGSFNSIPSRHIISKEELTRLYCEELLTCSQIAKIKNCSGQAIKAWLRKHNIPRRSQSESMRIRYSMGMVSGFREHNGKGEKLCR